MSGTQTAPDSGHLGSGSAPVNATSTAGAGGGGGGNGGAPAGPPPPLTVEEALREEVEQLKQRLVRVQKGHKIQLEQLYEENQMLIQDLLQAEGEIAALKASGAALTARAGATPSVPGAASSRSSSGGGGKGAGKNNADDNVDPLVRRAGGAGGAGEAMSLAMVPHDSALSSKVSSDKNLTCVHFSRRARTASLVVVGGASRVVSLVQWRRSSVLAAVELGGPILCASFRPAAVDAGAGTSTDTTYDLVAVGSMDGSLTLLRATSTLAAGGDGEVSTATLEVVQAINLGGQASVGRGASRYIKFAKWSACGSMLAVSLGQTVVVYTVNDGGDAPTLLPAAEGAGAGAGAGAGGAAKTDGDAAASGGPLTELKRFYFQDSVEAIALLPAVPVPVELEAGGEPAARAEGGEAEEAGTAAAAATTAATAVAAQPTAPATARAPQTKVLPSLVVAEQGNCYLHRVYLDLETIRTDEDIGRDTEWLNVNEKGDDHVSFSIMSIEPHPRFGERLDGGESESGEAGGVAFPCVQSFSQHARYLLLANNKNRHFVVNTATQRVARSFYGHAAGDYFQPMALWSAGGGLVVSNSQKDNAVHYWKVRSSESEASTRAANGHTSWIRGVDVSRHAPVVASVAFDHKLRFWTNTAASQ